MSKRKEDDFINDEESDGSQDYEEEKSTKKSKKTPKQDGGSDGLDKDGRPYFKLDGKKRVTISKFKGKNFVDIREYYEKDGEELPSKKGISLPINVWKSLLSKAEEINELLKD